MRNDRVSASFYQIIHISSFLPPLSLSFSLARYHPPTFFHHFASANNKISTIHTREREREISYNGKVEKPPVAIETLCVCDVRYYIKRTCNRRTMTRLESPWVLAWARKQKNSSAAERSQHNTTPFTIIIIIIIISKFFSISFLFLAGR